MRTVLVSVLVVVAFGAGVLVGATVIGDDDASSDTAAPGESSVQDAGPVGDTPGDDGEGGEGGGETSAGIIPGSPSIECELFSETSYWYADVSDLPVHEQSDTYIESIGADATIHPDFGTIYEEEPIGIPYGVTTDETTEVDISFDYDDESDPGSYRIPPDAPIEGGPDSDGDRHVIVVDNQECLLYELFYAFPESATTWSASSGAIFDLTSNALRPRGWTSADAAGLPILPALIGYNEVAAGEIDHALRFTVEATQDSFVWPARHQAGDEDESLPPMGAWFRLRDNIDLSGFSPEVRPILEAMQRHGMILADNGGPMFVSGVPDERWDDEILAELSEIVAADFEVVDTSSLIVDPDSGEAAR